MSVSDQSVADRARAHLDVLRDIQRKLIHPVDARQLLRILHDDVSRLFDTAIFILGLYDETSQTVEIVGQIISGEERPGGAFPLGSGFTSQAIRTREPLLIRDWSRSGPRVQVQYATDRAGLPESGMTVPIIFGERVLGVLLCQSYRDHAYDDDDLATFEAVAAQAAMALENMRRSERLDEQLQRQVSELEVILAAMSEALLIVDAEGCIVRLNNAARALLRLEQGSIILGQPLDREQWGQWPLGAREIAESLAPVIDALRDGRSLDDVDVEFQAGERRVLCFSSAPMHDSSGNLLGGVIVVRDVTERRVVEELKDELIAIASHDLKTPIQAVRMQAQILSRQFSTGHASPSDVEGGLTKIIRQADRLTELLNLLLDLSRIEAGRLQLHSTPIDLVPFIQSMIDDVRATTDRHQFTLNARGSATGLWDKPRLGQVLQNLLSNAVKYSPDGGMVEVAVEASPDTVTVSVRDEGVGIARDEIPHLFERFYRANEARRLEGAGLGLYICRGIITAHGGRIWAESEGPGQGSTFRLILPRQATI